MEFKFESEPCTCLERYDCGPQLLEQTLEIKVGEEMPEVGRILGVWGQVLLRGKEWRGNTVGLSGGVMVWALYDPEDGGAPGTAEGWIPFQTKWTLPDQYTDGRIQGDCIIKAIDARSISAKKLIVRAEISVSAQIYSTHQAVLFCPPQLPKDVQILEKTYPVRLINEAGEKEFDLEDSLAFPATSPHFQKIVHCQVSPQVTETKIMADKIVFRGDIKVHLCYLSQENVLCCEDFTLPYSQYQDLETEHEPDAETVVSLCITSVETEIEENGNIHLKISIVAQYIVLSSKEIVIVEDAYGINRKVTAKIEDADIPAVLERKNFSVPAEIHPVVDGTRMADVSFYPEAPVAVHSMDGVSIGLRGNFQILYYDMEGMLQCQWQPWESEITVFAAENCKIYTQFIPANLPEYSMSGGNLDLRSMVQFSALTVASNGMRGISSLTADNPEKPDAARPSLILRRAGNCSLWDLAKKNGTTVDAIRSANGLTEEPVSEQMLLIPIF